MLLAFAILSTVGMQSDFGSSDTQPSPESVSSGKTLVKSANGQNLRAMSPIAVTYLEPTINQVQARQPESRGAQQSPQPPKGENPARDLDEFARRLASRNVEQPSTRLSFDPNLRSVGKDAPAVMGNFLGVYAGEKVTVTSLLSNVILPHYADITDYYVVLTPQGNRGPFMVAENESPWPEDRVYYTHNTYYHVDARKIFSSSDLTLNPIANLLYPNNGPEPHILRTTFQQTIDNDPNAPHASLTNLTANQVQRDTLGFEKTFSNGAGSVELRLPIVHSPASFSARPNEEFLATFADFLPITATTYAIQQNESDSFLGDITLLLKWAIYRDEDAGRVISIGSALTIPTSSIPTIAGQNVRLFIFQPSLIRSFIIQPFLGYVYTLGSAYVQGFTSLAIPTNSQDITLWFNNFALGYYAYRDDSDRWLRGITPTAELHFTTAVRGNDQYFYMPDSLVGTFGVHFDIGDQSRLTLGVSTPFTTPRPNSAEAIIQYNFYW